MEGIKLARKVSTNKALQRTQAFLSYIQRPKNTIELKKYGPYINQAKLIIWFMFSKLATVF